MGWVLVFKVGMCLGMWCVVDTATYPDADSCWKAADTILERGAPEGKKIYAYCKPEAD